MAKILVLLFPFLLAAAGGAGLVGQSTAQGERACALCGTAYPADLDVPVPQPEPALPAGIDAYDPPALITSASGPAISEMLRTAGPDEIVTMSGLNFIGGTTKFDIFAQTGRKPGVLVAVEPMGLDSIAASIQIPADLVPWSMYLIWPNNAGVRGKPFALNRTDSWWVGPSLITPGETVSVFGRNLAKANGTSQSFIYLKRPGRSGTWVTPVRVNPYRVEFVVPDLPAGDYEVWAHNGHGGRFGWSGPLRLSVAPASPWAGQATRVYDVKAFGAKGDGSSDDGGPIAAALAAAAANAPATIYFPAGTYAAKRSFNVPSNVRWLGDGRDLSTLKFVVPLSEAGGPGFLYGSPDPEGVTFADIAIDADGRIDAWPHTMIFFNARNARFLNVRLSSWGAPPFETRSHGLFFDDVEIIGRGSFVSSTSQLFLNDTIFRMTDDGEAAVIASGGRDIAVTNTHVYNADETRSDGHGIGRLFVAQGQLGSIRNMYFAGNATHNGAPRDCKVVDCNKGEQIIWEFGSLDLKGKAVAVSPSSVRFGSLEVVEQPGGTEIIVVGGRGVGQRRRIVLVEDATAVLDRPWNVVPDTSTSLFVVTAIAEKAVVYRNRFEGRSSHSEHDSNSTAVLVWGTCYDIVIDGNDVSQMRHGLMVAATAGSGLATVSAPFFILATNNRIRDGNNGIYTGLTFGFDTDPGVYGGIGNVFRGNIISDMSNSGIAFDTWDTTGGQFEATVFEHNRVLNVKYGLISALMLIWTRAPTNPTPPHGTRLANTVLYANSFERGTGSTFSSIGFKASPFQSWVTRDTRWVDFAGGNAGPQ